MSQNSLDLFGASCGLAGPLRLTLTHEQKVEQRLFELPAVLVGREERADLRLEHGEISRRHTYLQVLGGRLLCVDVSGRARTRWGKDRRSSGWLDPGQPVTVGPFTLELAAPVESSADARDWNPLQDRVEDSHLLPPVTVEVLSRGGRRMRWQMNRALVLVGSSRACRIRLANASVSRFHCSLVGTPMGWWVVDLLSREGTSLNGQPVRCARIEDGDRLQVGVYTLRLRAGSLKSSPRLLCGPKEGPHVGLPEERRLSRPNWPKAAPTPVAETVPGTGVAELSRPNRPKAAPTSPESETSLAGPMTPLPEPRAGRAEIALPAGFPGANLTGTNPADGPSFLPVLQQFGLMQQQMFDQFNQAMVTMAQMFTTLHQDQMTMVREELEQLHKVNEELRALQDDLKRKPAAPETAAYRTAATREHSFPVGFSSPSPDKPTGATSLSTPPPSPSLPIPEQPVDEGVHIWLSQRIATLNQDRQTRWQKILGMVTGK
jgi:pSer/pThr/pTyr-binding forkhead associated (FHA) protein